MRGFFHRVRGRTGTQKSDLSMLLSTNFAILHETETKHPNLYLVKGKNYKLLLMRMLCILRSRNGTWFEKICLISSRKYCSQKCIFF
jgi:hypothetical protein